MKSNLIYVFAKWRVNDGELATVLGLLPSVVEKSSNEPGNVFYKVFQSTSEPNTLMLHECYKDETALATHKNSPHFLDVVVAQIVPLLADREVQVTSEIL